MARNPGVNTYIAFMRAVKVGGHAIVKNFQQIPLDKRGTLAYYNGVWEHVGSDPRWGQPNRAPAAEGHDARAP